jgi:hypothetical protein
MESWPTGRVAVLMPPIPEHLASPTLAEAWRLRAEANASGICPSWGAELVMPNRADRRRAKATGAIPRAEMNHGDGCVVSDAGNHAGHTHWHELMNDNLEADRRYRRGQKVAPFCYAVYFPEPGMLKIGTTTNRAQAIYVSAARQGARARDWNAEGSCRVWHEPGDERVEAYLQASLAFGWPGACTGRQLRLSEWFKPGVPVDQIVDRLTEVYRRVPPDRLEPRP